MYLGMYTTGILVCGQHSWVNTVLCNTEEEAIGQCLAVVNVEHIRVIRIPGMMKYGVPDSLKSIQTIEAEQINYAESEDTEQHAGECDSVESDPPDCEVSG